jgi:hypothetical protein
MKVALRRRLTDSFSGRLRHDEVEINRLLKRIRSPRCSTVCLRTAARQLEDLSLDVRLIMAIRRRMLARLK